MNQFCVYMHISPSNKKYIGITSQPPQYRWNHGKGYDQQPYFHNAISKYGWKNIRHVILFTRLSEQEAKAKEIELIQRFHTSDSNFGYNLTLGGEGTLGRYVSPEEREATSKRSKGNKYSLGKVCAESTKAAISRANKGNKHFLGKHHSDATKQKDRIAHLGKRNGMFGKIGKESHSSKPVWQLDLQNNRLKRWDSMSDVERELGIPKTLIVRCCKGKQQKTNGYRWEYA